ncbi:M64 family metallo-endopeptidase [Sphingobacterium sp. SRCM116780]|uniref:M64 family metallopeptidase n=1 Tax=Sphingobacterium sp. SRCM116780 TaxID=2907623 RepID=UPI001F40318B|nr:M64 family metallopeptidase [Sphingobacterium sp. SRCM116780]UIR56192.1 M64 family metallo-endopeptidase [Sphingobacterium sp. SRCM116780]
MKTNFLPLVFTVLFLLLFQSIFAQKYEVDTLQYQGTSKDIVNLVILGDGYTQNQLTDFEEDAKRFTTYFFQTEPFRQYSNYFNVFAIKTISKESGATHAGQATDCVHGDIDLSNFPARFNQFTKKYPVPITSPNTIFGSSFDNGGLHRLVVPQKNEVIEEILKTHIPNYTQVVILVNSPFYGGSGGKYATATVNFMSNDIAVHEIGHSFAILADEYWAGNQYAIEGPNRTQESDPTKVPWKRWIGTQDIGVYSYGGKESKSTWFRPHEFCKMQYLVAPFCAVCQETFVETIHHKTNPIVNTKPQVGTVVDTDLIQAFSLKLLKPSPNTLEVKWYLNEELIGQDIDSIYLNPGMLTLGTNRLKAVVKDTTLLVRNESHQKHTYEKEWSIMNENDHPPTAPLSTWGDTLQTCFNGGQVLSVKNASRGLRYNWYTDADTTTPILTGTNVTVNHVKANAAYYVESVWKDKKSVRNKVLLQVFDEIERPIGATVKLDKKLNKIRITLKDKPDDRYNYLWCKEDGTSLYEWDEFNGEYVPPKGSNNIFFMDRSNSESKIYVVKVDKLTTCRSERLEILIPEF